MSTRNLLNIGAKGVAIVMVAAAIVVGLARWNRQLICDNVPALGFCDIEEEVRLLPPEKLISAGEKPSADSVVKLDEPYEELKNQGIEALSQAAPSPDKYDEAIKAFQQVREIATKKKKEEEERNAKDSPQWKAALADLQDPVTLIFLNNAKARKNAKENGSPLYTIATAAPLNQEEGKQILL